jgi:hypothetical protein
MPRQHYIQTADGSIRTAVEREWRAAVTCRISSDRASAAVAVTLTTEGDEVTLGATWLREPPDDARYATLWSHRDPAGGRWSVEYGYDGRFWCLFGPCGSPWGRSLGSTIAGSLADATEYMARAVARAKDKGLA